MISAPFNGTTYVLQHRASHRSQGIDLTTALPPLDLGAGLNPPHRIDAELKSGPAGVLGGLIQDAEFQGSGEVDFFQVFRLAFDVDRLDDECVSVENRLDRAGAVFELAAAGGE